MEIGSEAVVLADTACGDCLIIGDGQDGSSAVESKETGKFWDCSDSASGSRVVVRVAAASSPVIGGGPGPR